eukprot:2870324-Pyramimonas_sp.AAC.1
MVSNFFCRRTLEKQILYLLICVTIWPVGFFISRVPFFWPPRKFVTLTERRHVPLWAFLADASFCGFTRRLDFFNIRRRSQRRGAWRLSRPRAGARARSG